MLLGIIFDYEMRFFLSKDVQKMLKRKDSDAGEHATQVLDRFQGLLVSNLKTPEAAKRLQHQLCGPTMALSFNFLVAVGIILINKLLLGRIGFNYPIALTLVHYGVSWVLLGVLNAASLLPVAPPSKATPFTSLLALGVVMAFSNGLANVSLKHNSVGFYQMSKIAVTPTIVLAEFLFLGKQVSVQKVLALTVVSLGVAIATVTDLQFHLFGALVAVTWVVPSAINKILWSNLQQQDGWTALGLMWKTTPLTVFSLVALMPWLDPPGFLAFHWSFSNTVAILISAALGFLLQWSGALALGATSATTHVVLGQFKTCVILLGGFIFFHSNPGLKSLSGATMALSGMALYTFLNLREGNDSGSNKSTLKSHAKPNRIHGEAHEGNEASLESV
ncbi:hypothetical protein O6H91_22G025500 [Diphasiastrum complanatum]|uniref:Uncharacterized protein n=1 Tax=Diphasiastrum complanatum TaxID=34168 RepID=A0ACC2AE23_DIPCM|nr:hypothetical protein O6H91_22G025500 [Diphasiastrum complanatum]